MVPNQLSKALDRLFKMLISLKTAVFIILGLALVSAVGTIYETLYDSNYAQKIVYHSPYMYALLGLLCTTLTCVIIDRYPWKRHHLGFILAHIGIIILVLGSVITRYFGIDGNMVFPIGKSNRYVNLSDSEIAVYSSFDGQKYTTLAHRLADFLLYPPNEKNRYDIPVGTKTLSIVDYYHYAERKSQILEDPLKKSGPAVRFQLEGPMADVAEWIILSEKKPYQSMTLGMTKVVLTDDIYPYSGGNAFVLKSMPQVANTLSYEIYSRHENKKVSQGTVKVGDVVSTPWMGMKFRLLAFLPHAKDEVSFIKKEYPNKVTESAIKIKYGDEEHWMQRNSNLKLFDTDKVIVVGYGAQRIDLGFSIHLTDFRVGRYQGVQKAAAYESDVVVDETKYNISMNEPLKHHGYTFYQASFESDEEGKPVASVLSVNKDPGRVIKYIGSLLIVLGTILLAYFKKALVKKKLATKTK